LADEQQQRHILITQYVDSPLDGVMLGIIEDAVVTMNVMMGAIFVGWTISLLDAGFLNVADA